MSEGVINLREYGVSYTARAIRYGDRLAVVVAPEFIMSDELCKELSKLYISESDYDYILRECKSLGLIYRCPPPGVYFLAWKDVVFYCFPQPPDKLEGVSIDDIAVRTRDGEAICYLYINSTWLKRLKKVDALESVKEDMKRQLTRCCQYHLWYNYMGELSRKWSSGSAPKRDHLEEVKGKA
jgi:hypothetical protein